MGRIENITQKRLIEHMNQKLELLSNRVEKLEKMVTELKFDLEERKNI